MKIALCGLGRAGTQVLRRIIAQEGTEVIMVFCSNGSKKAGKEISDVLPIKDLHIPIYEVKRAEEVFRSAVPDVLIDFSSKQGTMQILPACAKYGVSMVVCTTNFTASEISTMRKTATDAPNFALSYAPNITLGVNVLMYLCAETARMLPSFDYAITEKHHNRKKDVSATAKKIAEVLSGELRHDVQVNSIRAGGYVGLHEVLAVGEFERITIIHESFSRQAFANGALIAAAFLEGKQGYFEMQDIVAHHLREGIN